MKKSTCLLFAIILLMFSPVFGQEKDNISPDETIAYINSKLTGIAKLSNERGLLIVEFYKNGKVNRTDKVPIEALNPENVEYIADEKALVVRCIANDCIDRKIEIPKTRGQFSRMSFAGEYDAKAQVGLVKAFEHLIMMFRDRKYKSNKPFEE
jgi:hypothetical protein